MLSVLNTVTSRLGLATPPTFFATPPSPPSLSLPDSDSNEPPPFPLPNSIQRASSHPPVPPPTFSFDAPSHDDDEDSHDGEDGSALPPIKMEKTALAPPTSTVKLAKRVKVSIEKGYSQLDWGRLKSSGADLRGGVQQLMRITPSELAKHKSREDCWQAYGGKVYNVTPFLKYHPGGIPELMRANGRDGTELFMKTHAWVNVDLMMDGCMIGFMVRE